MTELIREHLLHHGVCVCVCALFLCRTVHVEALFCLFFFPFREKGGKGGKGDLKRVTIAVMPECDATFLGFLLFFFFVSTQPEAP